MTDQTTPAELKAQLSRTVEALAMQVVVGPGRPGLDAATAALEILCRQASEAGQSGIAETAAAVLQSVSDPAAAESSPEVLSDGLLRLQSAIESIEEPPPTCAGTPLAQDPELLADFITESREHLSSIETRLLALERDPGNQEPLHAVFRGFHTIKGLAGFLEFHAIKEVAHEVETALDLAREGKLAITPEVIDVMLAAADYLKAAIRGVEAASRGAAPEPQAGHGTLVERLRRLAAGGPAPCAGPAATLEQAEKSAGSMPEAGSPETLSIRVDAAKLDYLVEMVGELVIAQSMVRHDPALGSIQNPKLAQNLSQLARTTSEVRNTVMAIRMVPVEPLFHRTARLARDLVRKAGKQAVLEMSGEDTELDKTIVEELADPLLHMIRNAVDHGIEDPASRRAAGKNPAARIALRASHQGGHIAIEVSDDGRGLDRDRILDKAVRSGLVEQGRHMSDAEVFNLIFEPGFSTAAQVTEISGRGVGMDVVRKQVQKLRGRIEIQSVAGEGARFLIKLPLTLAIIDGLVVTLGRERYIIPLFAVKEMFRPAPEMISTVQNRGEVAMVRGRLLPVVRLRKRFGGGERLEDPAESLLIVTESAGKPFCLMVDGLAGKQEVVIKSLGGRLKNIRGIAGGAILGDGRVGLILDMEGIFGAGAES